MTIKRSPFRVAILLPSPLCVVIILLCMLYSHGSMHKVPFSNLSLPFLFGPYLLIHTISPVNSFLYSLLLFVVACSPFIIASLYPWPFSSRIPASSQVEIGSARYPTSAISFIERATFFLLIPGPVESPISLVIYISVISFTFPACHFCTAPGREP